MASARPAPRPAVLPDKTVDDVKDVCERIHELANAKPREWDLKKLGEKAGHAWQSFNNWKQGHQSPKVNLLQDFAAAVGGRIRVILETVEGSQGGKILLPPGGGGNMARRADDEDLSGVLDRLGVTDPGIRRKAVTAAREAAARTAIEEYKDRPGANPKEPTAEQASPSRSRRKTSSGK